MNKDIFHKEQATLPQGFGLGNAFAVCAASFGLLLATPAQAVGISLMEISTSGLGNAYAGSTAEANDPSAMFFNPAALTRFKKAEQMFSAVAIKVNTEYTDSQAGSNGYPAGGQTYARDPSYGIAPSNFLAIPITDKLVAGFGVSGSAGLLMRYENDYPGRFQSKSTDIKVTRVNAGFGYKMTNALSLGANLSIERFFQAVRTDVDYAKAAAVEPGLNGLFGNALRNPVIGGAFFDAMGNSRSAPLKLKLYSTAVNAQVGALFEPTEQTRIGFSYRPKTKFDLKGSYKWQAAHPDILMQAAPELLADGLVTSTITLPSETRLSVFHRLNKQFDLMADVTRFDYTSVEKITYTRADGQVLKSYIQNAQAGNRYALGANHRMFNRLTLRYGYSQDEATISDRYRVTALPDQARKNFNFGLQYQFAPRDFVDFGLQYTLFDDARIQQRDDLQGMEGEKSFDGDLNGTVSNKVVFMGIQYRGDF